ncbi:oligosaccharide flippase family protein [Anatilimnocola sp. NA78]|uniref:oligosaccharide flippase family protein n=1 Tax=Anatilimnocola sp. NA78 TaxID=3415683 RepID=UPI003CE58A3C
MSVDPTSTDAVEDAKLAQAARSGAPLVLAGHLVSQLMGVGTLGVLLHLLKPEDYGILGTVLPAVMLPRMAATLGPGIAVLQQKELSQQQLSSLFWLQTGAGLIAAIATAVICWIQASLWNQPVLFLVGSALGVGTLLATLGNQHQALLERNLRFNAGIGLRLTAQAITCVASIAHAWYWPNVWALVTQHVVELAVLWLGSWLLAGWWPNWPQRASWGDTHVRFSAAYSFSSLLQYLAQNLEKVLLPIFAGPAGNYALGLYTQAFGLMVKPVYLLTTPIAGVMISSLAKTEPGSDAFAQMTSRFFRLSSLGLFPSAVGLTLVSDDVVALLGGQKWQAAGLLLKILAPSLAALGLTNLCIFVLSSRGEGRTLVYAAALLLLLKLQTLGLGYFLGQQFIVADVDPAYRGIVGLAAGFTLLNTCIWSIAFLWFTFRSVQLDPLHMLKALWPSLRAALVMGLAVMGLQWLLREIPVQSAALRLLLSVAGGVLVFVALAWSEINQVVRQQPDRPAKKSAR